MKILFWNTYRNKNINNYVLNLVEKYDVDILLLAEYKGNLEDLDSLLICSNQKLERCNTVGCNRIEMWSNLINVDPGIQNDYYSIQIINNQLIICGVHLFSNLNENKDDERLEKIKEIKLDINTLEKNRNSNKVIIIGDFNEMPYGKGCLYANGFHGLPILNDNDKITRKVYGAEYTKYYNPMWNFFGDFNYPPGTYYYSNSSSFYSPMWYIFDQVLMSKEVIPFFRKESLEIITNGLTNKNGHPNKKISDHFPIVLEIKEEILYE